MKKDDNLKVKERRHKMQQILRQKKSEIKKKIREKKI